MAKKTVAIGDNSDAQLHSFFERINTLIDEKDKIVADLKELYIEIKKEDVDTKALKKAVAISRKDREKWNAEQEALDAMLAKLGMI